VNWESNWLGAAVGELLEIAHTDRRQADRIHRAVEAYARTAEGDVLKLSGRSDEWRLRVGDWRVFFTIDRGTRRLTVFAVKRRSEGTYRD
jgi:mRNA-degrading endonuclease RelE of RelBE toxin-antitoxin system